MKVGNVIMSTPMVPPLLREAEAPGTGKSMTRRLAWRRPYYVADLSSEAMEDYELRGWQVEPAGILCRITKPTHWQKMHDRFQAAGPGYRELLYVRERLDVAADGYCAYAADDCKMPETENTDGLCRYYGDPFICNEIKGIPSIHMPRWASRLTLEVTATKMEPLQEISEEDAKAEGWEKQPWRSADPDVHRDAARDWFSDLWISLHGSGAWDKNPEVVAPSFTLHHQNVDALLAEREAA